MNPGAGDELDIQRLVSSPVDRKRIYQLVGQDTRLANMEREARAARQPVRESIKHILNRYDISKCFVGLMQVQYYNSPRLSISKEKLLAMGVHPKVIAACTVSVDSWQLRITPKKEDEPDVL
jgi:hypothetical protein